MDLDPQEQIVKRQPNKQDEKLKKKFVALKLLFLLSSIIIILSITLWPIIKESPEKIFFATQPIKTNTSSNTSLTMENARISGINQKKNKYSIGETLKIIRLVKFLKGVWLKKNYFFIMA